MLHPHPRYLTSRIPQCGDTSSVIAPDRGRCAAQIRSLAGSLARSPRLRARASDRRRRTLSGLVPQQRRAHRVSAPERHPAPARAAALHLQHRPPLGRPRALLRHARAATSSTTAPTRPGTPASAGTSSPLAGENIAWGTGSYGSPEGIVKQWMNIPPHRAIILTRASSASASASRPAPSRAPPAPRGHRRLRRLRSGSDHTARASSTINSAASTSPMR